MESSVQGCNLTKLKNPGKWVVAGRGSQGQSPPWTSWMFNPGGLDTFCPWWLLKKSWNPAITALSVHGFEPSKHEHQTVIGRHNLLYIIRVAWVTFFNQIKNIMSEAGGINNRIWGQMNNCFILWCNDRIFQIQGLVNLLNHIQIELLYVRVYCMI